MGNMVLLGVVLAMAGFGGAGLTPFERGEKWGYKDARGKVVLEARFTAAMPFSGEGIAAVLDERGWAYLDDTGKVVMRPLVVDNGPDYFREGLARFAVESRLGFFDQRGQVVIPPAFSFALPFSEGLAAFCVGCQEVAEGEHQAMRGGRWGFINRKGEPVIPAQFEEAGGFENGRARVKLGGQWKMIDRRGELAGAGPDGPAAPAAPQAGPRNIILIGWDGAQRNHVKEMIARGELPNLVALARQGKMVDIDVVSGATDTKAGWTQILTGYAPEKTGVYSNGRYQPIPVGYSVFERLEQFFGPQNIETRAFIAKKGHVDADGPRKVPYEQWLKKEAQQKKIDRARPGRGNLQGGRIVEEGGSKFVEVPGKPWYNAQDHMDSFVNGLRLNETVAKMAMENLEKSKDQRFFFFIHFAEPDHAGHGNGENSAEYSQALQQDDLWTGRIIAQLQGLGLWDKTLVYVVVDHGFNEGESGHRYAPYVFLATNDQQVSRNGTREDIAPTVLKRFGLDLGKIEPKLDGIALDEPAPERKAPAEPAQPRRAKRKR